jgi:hypothetical protein
MKKRTARALTAAALALTAMMAAVGAVEEAQRFRLLSITETSKMILVSEIPAKNKFVLDASTAKIMVDGKPAEFQELRLYTVIHVKFDARKSSKDGINLDGVASEIKVNTPENAK